MHNLETPGLVHRVSICFHGGRAILVGSHVLVISYFEFKNECKMKKKNPSNVRHFVFMMERWIYKETFTSKYIHITHSFGYLLIYNGTCFMVATVCHHVCIARITTRSVKRDLVEKVLGKQRNNIMIFCSVFFKINIFIDGISQNPGVGGNKGTPSKCEILRKWGGGL